jgi:hypothetical protein
MQHIIVDSRRNVTAHFTAQLPCPGYGRFYHNGVTKSHMLLCPTVPDVCKTRLFTLITLGYLVLQKSTVLRRVITPHTARRTTTIIAMRIAFHSSVYTGYR